MLLSLCLGGQWGAAGGALALGPFTHLVLARQLENPALAAEPSWRRALYAGALAPDAGYYPGGEDSLAQAAHLLGPWEICRALADLAATPEERAFALGYASHALLDRLGHAELVNRLAGRPYSADPLNHKRVEWGLDCRLLSEPGNQWLWTVQADSRGGLGLWRRALERVYGKRVPAEVLERSLAAELAEVWRLPRIFWLSGQAERPGAWLGNSAGWLLGHSLRPLAVSLLAWRGGYINERAVLDARPARPEDLRGLEEILGRVAARVRDSAAIVDPPLGNLDADPACDREACAGAVQARAWLRGLP